VLKSGEQNRIVNVIAIKILLPVAPEMCHLPIPAGANHLSDLLLDSKNRSRTGISPQFGRERWLLRRTASQDAHNHTTQDWSKRAHDG
jgi:hypothetical protein